MDGSFFRKSARSKIKNFNIVCIERNNSRSDDNLEIRNDGLYYDPGETEPFTGLSHEDIDKGDGWFQRRSIHLLKGKIMLETFKDTS